MSMLSREPTPMTQIPDSPLNDFINTFYGYGNFSGKYWFIGMEEGGGDTLDEIQRRINLWDRRGRHELEDLCGYHLELGITQFFTEPTKSQSTWNKLIRLVLSTRLDAFMLDDVKAYQRERLGRWEQDTALIELLPLPSPSTSHWLYSAWDIPHLRTRATYRQHYAPLRVQAIRAKIAQYQPSAVVFYSLGYREWWQQIANVEFVPNGRFFTASDEHTRYVMAPHPTGHGVMSEDYHAIGHWLRQP